MLQKAQVSNKVEQGVSDNEEIEAKLDCAMVIKAEGRVRALPDAPDVDAGMSELTDMQFERQPEGSVKKRAVGGWPTPPWRLPDDQQCDRVSTAATQRSAASQVWRPRSHGRRRGGRGREGGDHAALRVNRHGVEPLTSRRLAEEAAPVTTDVRKASDVVDLAVAFAATDVVGRRILHDTRAFSQLRHECCGEGQSKGHQVLSTARQLLDEMWRKQVPAADASRMEVQVQLFRRSEAAYTIMLMVTRHNTWEVHPAIYKMVDGFIPFRFLLTLEASRNINPPLEAKDFWNAMEIDYLYPDPRLDLRRGAADEEVLVRSTRRQTFWFPTSCGKMAARADLNPAALVSDDSGPSSSSTSRFRPLSGVLASSSVAARTSDS
jgi:hypothetical protein